MATLVTVHGTFAHLDDGVTPAGADELWWERGSAFDTKMNGSVAGLSADGTSSPLRIEPFVWSGNNSEIERRAASLELLALLQDLEARGENYCVVGHSHGGSVVSMALLTAAARNVSLPGLQRWITVGTPFIAMRPMPRLIERLQLVDRVVLVASMMLLMMFLFYAAGQVFEPGVANSDETPFLWSWRTIIAAVMMSVPAIFFTLVYGFIDRQSLIFYRPSTIERARTSFEAKWLPLCHANDEAVQGLKSLPGATVQVFDRGFAAQRLTTLAVFAVPLAYLFVLGSPPTMLAIAGVLQNKVYHVATYAKVETAYDAERTQIRRAVRKIRQAPVTASTPPADPAWNNVRAMREQMKQHFPDYVAIERALRFKHEFLEIDGTPCPGAVLCGGGRDFATNSRLLFHAVTDDLTSALINDDTRFGNYGPLVRAAIPMVVVPLVSIFSALLFMVALGWAARQLSSLLAHVFNRVTLSELKREIYGNDTTGEVAFDAGPRPPWLLVSRPYLPDAIAQLLTDHADRAASASLAKFRNAISAIALATGGPTSSAIVSNYLTWKELIHSTYFDLPEFQLLVARAIVSAPGFVATPALLAEAGYAQTGGWLRQVGSIANLPVVQVSPPNVADKTAQSPQPVSMAD